MHTKDVAYCDRCHM